MPPYRPFFTFGSSQLEQHFLANRDVVAELQKLENELTHRNTSSARQLRERVNTQLAALSLNGAEASVPHAAAADPESDRFSESEIDFAQTEWDSKQRAIIEMDSEALTVVDAGPGAGKTAAACKRVAHLIEEDGLDAAKIFLLSFTRAAVKEIRDRIEAYAENPVNVAGLMIATLDSFTWQVLRGFGTREETNLISSYEGNIESFVSKLRERHSDLLNYLAELQHVIIDEGQDLVGSRADLVIQLIQALPSECGVTVFADRAQAIYGFTDDNGYSRDQCGSASAVERIMRSEAGAFERHVLDQIHRTKDPRLHALFTVGRKKLLNLTHGSADSWRETRELIEQHAHGTVGAVDSQGLAGQSSHLVLYRTRAEVIFASSLLWNKDIPHKLRMSKIPRRVHPWIARIFERWEHDAIDRAAFEALWAARLADSGGVLPAADRAWQILYENAGERNGRVRVDRLREILSRDRPPLDFIVDEEDLPGPVLGTIHASKGRESRHVHLMLPVDGFIEWRESNSSPTALAEEERVLFVGATRARQRLMTGKGISLGASMLPSRRVYRRTKRRPNARQMEVGMNNDFDLLSLAVDDEEAVTDRQDWLWENATQPVKLEARYESESRRNVLYAGDRRLGFLTQAFSKDLFAIAKKVGEVDGQPYRPGSVIRDIRMTGVTTAVLPAARRSEATAPWRHSGFLLAPVISGFPLVYFNPVKS